MSHSFSRLDKYSYKFSDTHLKILISPSYFVQYVGIDANVVLKQTYVKLVDDSRAKPEILNLSLTDLGVKFQQRPAAEAIK